MIKEIEYINLTNQEYLLVEKGLGNEVAENTVIQRFIYDSDDKEVTGFAAFPEHFDGKLPVIIWNRGGNNKSGLIDNFLAYSLLGEIASWGYLVLSSQYRNDDEFGGSDVNDVINLIDLADSFDFCNPEKIGMEGWSRGGMMTYLALTRTKKISCAVIISGLADLLRNSINKDIFSNNLLDKISSKDEISANEQLIKRSAVQFADKINKNSSVLLIHVTDDKKISYLDSQDMYEKLRFYNQKGIYELKLINGGDHYLKDSKKEISELRKNWYDSFLKL